MIQTNQTAVDTISYEIRSLDATRLIANADVTSYEERSGKITADLQIQNLLEEGEEYLMIIRLGSGDRSICYYTRIAEPVDCYVSECVAFVKDFKIRRSTMRPPEHWRLTWSGRPGITRRCSSCR